MAPRPQLHESQTLHKKRKTLKGILKGSGRPFQPAATVTQRIPVMGARVTKADSKGPTGGPRPVQQKDNAAKDGSTNKGSSSFKVRAGACSKPKPSKSLKEKDPVFDSRWTVPKGVDLRDRSQEMTRTTLPDGSLVSWRKAIDPALLGWASSTSPKVSEQSTEAPEPVANQGQDVRQSAQRPVAMEPVGEHGADVGMDDTQSVHSAADSGDEDSDAYIPTPLPSRPTPESRAQANADLVALRAARARARAQGL